MAENLMEMADKLRDLKEEKDRLQKDLKEVNAGIEEINGQLVSEMMENELQSFKRNGITFYLQTDYYASVIADEGKQAQLYRNLRGEGFGDIIRETIHPQTLKAFSKEQFKEHDHQLPSWLEGLINFYPKDSVRMRKG